MGVEVELSSQELRQSGENMTIFLASFVVWSIVGILSCSGSPQFVNLGVRQFLSGIDQVNLGGQSFPALAAAPAGVVGKERSGRFFNDGGRQTFNGFARPIAEDVTANLNERQFGPGGHEVFNNLQTIGQHDLHDVGHRNVQSFGHHDIQSGDHHDIQSLGDHDIQSSGHHDIQSVSQDYVGQSVVQEVHHEEHL